MAMNIHSFERRAADTHEEAGVGFLMDQPVLRAVRADTVIEGLRRAMVGVEPGVEEALIVGAPGARAAGIGHPILKIGAAVEVADDQRVELGALVVIRPEQLAVVRRVVDVAQPEIGLALAFDIAVENDVLRPAVAWRAEIARLLAADPVGGAIGERTVLYRHRGIVFLDAPFHLPEELPLQRGGVVHQRMLVGILRFEMRADCRIERRRVAKNLLPIVGAQPGVVVDARDAVMGVGMRPFLRPRRLNR